ncbi:MAG: putative Phage portal protein lambda family [Gemmatimonadetes bacterium]|nr:putative Phage portal protein lambda family [Gemmatimonadota bacterium]
MADLAAADEAAAAPRVQANTMHAGAQHGRLTADWVGAVYASADRIVRYDLRVLRSRARQLARDNPHVTRFRRMMALNVVGPHGVRMKPKVRDLVGGLDRATNAALEAGWEDFGRAENFSADGRMSRAEMEAAYVESMCIDGEFICRKLPGMGKHGISYQWIDPDLLDERFNEIYPGSGNQVRMGIEVDRFGRHVAYHLWNRHPHDYQYAGEDLRRIRVPADQVIFDAVVLQAGQTRGTTPLAPVLLRLNMLEGYEQAELVAARVGAAKPGFFELDPDKAAPPGDPDDPDGFTPPTELPLSVEPGSWDALPAGWKATQLNPDHPTTAYPFFIKAGLRSVASGMNVGYSMLANDLSEASYSGLREGKLNDWKSFEWMQWRMIRRFDEPAYADYVKWSATTGTLHLPSLNFTSYTACTWHPDGMDWVDPLKDSLAAKADVEEGFASRTQVCARRGLDFETVVLERAEEERFARLNGVMLGAPVPVAVKPPLFDDGAPGKPSPPADDAAASLDYASRLDDLAAHVVALERYPMDARRLALQALALSDDTQPRTPVAP